MRWSRVRIVLGRELRDTLRDKRTLITMLVLPMVLYPTLMLGFGKLSATRVRDLMVEKAPVLIRVDGQAFRGQAEGMGEVEKAVAGIQGFDFQEDRGESEVTADLEAGRLELAVDLQSDLLVRMEQGLPNRIVPRFHSSRELSSSAARRLERALEAMGGKRFPLEFARDEGDMSSREQRGGQSFGGVLAMMVVFMAMAGTFYPAIDAAAGEKERGTLETLLLAPVSRTEVVAGKYLAVLVIGMVAGLMNLGSMAFTFTALPGSIGMAATISIAPRTLAVVLVGLFLVSALFSALCLALSTFARTYKEGQAYMTPALVVVMPLAMIAMLPNIKLDKTTAMVPVGNLCLLIKEMLAGRTPWQEAAITLIVLLAIAGAALHFTVVLFRREDVLFRDSKSAVAIRPAGKAELADRAPAGAALLAYLLAMAVLFHVGARFIGFGPLVAAAAPLAALALLAMVVARLSGAAVRPALGLFAPSAREWVRAVLLGPLLVGVSVLVAGLQDSLLGIKASDSTTVEELRKIVDAAGLPAQILVLALLPAIGEELLFRGLMLRAFQGVMRHGAAVAVTALLFAALHFDGARFFPQLAMGTALGFLVLRTGSVLPAVVAHALHNATALVAERASVAGSLTEAWVTLPAAAAVLILLWRRRKPE